MYTWPNTLRCFRKKSNLFHSFYQRQQLKDRNTIWVAAVNDSKRMSNCYYSSLLNQNGIPHDTKSLVHNKLSIWKNISKCYTAYSWYNMPCKNCINAIMAEFGTPSGSWNNARVGVLLNLIYYCTIINNYHYLRAESFFAIKCCNSLFILSI